MARRVALALVAALLVGTLEGCKSEEPPPPPPVKKRELDPAVSQKIDYAISMLNNENREDRYVKDLVAAAQTDDLAQRAAIDRTIAAIRQSWSDAPGFKLRSMGRVRAMRALDRFAGDDPTALDLFKEASKSKDAEISGAAASALATRGDASSFDSLVQSIKGAKGDRASQDSAAAALAKIAKPDQKDKILAAVDAGSRDAFAPVVSAVLPGEPEPRVQALAGIVKTHPNPNARYCALAELRRLKDPELVDFARSQANADDADLRGYARRLLVEQGGKVAALKLEEVLGDDPKDPDGAAKLLATVDSPETPRVACDTLANTARTPGARAACARFVLARVRDEKAVPALKDPSARERALGVLRRAISDPNDDVARASIEALGAAGDRSDAESLALLVARSPQQGPAAIAALGEVGGPAAVEKLIAVHETDPKLRVACHDALVGMKDLRSIDANQGVLLIMQLLSGDLEVRKSALSILRTLKGDSDVFDYDTQSDASARGRSVEKWIAWWKERVAQRGG